MKREVFYGVLLKQRQTGREFLAHGGLSGPALFYRRRGALRFRDELKTHNMTGKVIRVGAEFESPVKR